MLQSEKQHAKIHQYQQKTSYLQPFSQCADENFIVWQEESTNIQNLMVS